MHMEREKIKLILISSLLGQPFTLTLRKVLTRQDGVKRCEQSKIKDSPFFTSLNLAVSVAPERGTCYRTQIDKLSRYSLSCISRTQKRENSYSGNH